jgi:heme/copper-type cytochrome/quinol oxidase subunit 4
MDPGKVSAVIAGHSIMGIIIDVSLVVLPVRVVYTTMVSPRKSIRVVLIFSIGAFVVVTGVVRFVYICIEDGQEL